MHWTTNVLFTWSSKDLKYNQTLERLQLAIKLINFGFRIIQMYPNVSWTNGQSTLYEPSWITVHNTNDICYDEFLKVNFAMFFDQLFADTVVDKLPDDQTIIVREPKYFKQLKLVGNIIK